MVHDPLPLYTSGMGRYDNITDERLRAEVARFARILQRMEQEGETLDRTADILTLLGELRQMVFAWEVRCTFEEADDEDLSAPGGSAPEEITPEDGASPARRRRPRPQPLDRALTLSERVVAEAQRREQELREEFDAKSSPGEVDS